MRRARKLHLGCGDVFLPGYLNVDISSSFAGVGRPDHVADIRHLPHLASGSFDEVYACHVLEHIEFTDVLLTLREWHRLLAPGGTIRLSTPDLDAEIDAVREGRWQPRQAPAGLWPDRPFATGSHKLVAILVGGVERSIGEQHKVPFNFEFLQEVLTEVGFDEVRRYQSTTDDWSTKWPDSLNVVAKKRAAPATSFLEPWLVEHDRELLALRARCLTVGQIVGTHVVLFRQGRQQDCITLPAELMPLLQMLDGTRSIQSALEQSVSEGREYALRLIGQLWAERLVQIEGDPTKVYLMSPELRTRCFIGDMAGGLGVRPSSPRPLRLPRGVTLHSRGSVDADGAFRDEGALLVHGDVELQLDPLDHAIIKLLLVHSLAELRRAPDAYGIPKAEAGRIDALVARLRIFESRVGNHDEGGGATQDRAKGLLEGDGVERGEALV